MQPPHRRPLLLSGPIVHNRCTRSPLLLSGPKVTAQSLTVDFGILLDVKNLSRVSENSKEFSPMNGPRGAALDRTPPPSLLQLSGERQPTASHKHERRITNGSAPQPTRFSEAGKEQRLQRNQNRESRNGRGQRAVQVYSSGASERSKGYNRPFNRVFQRNLKMRFTRWRVNGLLSGK